MSFNQLATDAKKYFPDLQIKYKDQSLFMKLLGMLMFFNKDFMIRYSTTLGSTIYFPSRSFVDNGETTAQVLLLHELVHMSDAKKMGKLVFSFLYLLPLTLLPFVLLFVFLSWKIALILAILCILPLPAYFRMNLEKRAYMVSLYASYKLHAKEDQIIDFKKVYDKYLTNFTSANYYFMWLFAGLEGEFAAASEKIKAGNHPYEDATVFGMIDDLISKQ